jgi:hypothetical protein
MPSLYFRGEKLWSGMALPSKDTVPYSFLCPDAIYWLVVGAKLDTASWISWLFYLF